jgi:hypothetical protein
MNFDFQENEIVDHLLFEIEQHHGGKIQRIIKCEELLGSFKLSLIFDDYTYLEARVRITNAFNAPTLQVHGTYY